MEFDLSNINHDPPVRSNSHVLIIGPGKCGSTLLIKILTLCGLDTGYTMLAASNPAYESALEWPCRGEKAIYYLRQIGSFPYIIKSNLLSLDLKECIKRWGWEVEHIYILNRKTESIVKRHFVGRFGLEWEDKAPKNKISIRRNMIVNRKASLLDQLSSLDIPFTLLEFPRFAEEFEYTHRKMKSLLDTKCISHEKFKAVYTQIVDIAQLRGW